MIPRHLGANRSIYAAMAATLLRGVGFSAPRKTPEPKQSRYTTAELDLVRQRRTARNLKRGQQRLRADFLNPTVTDQQMMDRHAPETIMGQYL